MSATRARASSTRLCGLTPRLLYSAIDSAQRENRDPSRASAIAQRCGLCAGRSRLFSRPLYGSVSTLRTIRGILIHIRHIALHWAVVVDSEVSSVDTRVTAHPESTPSYDVPSRPAAHAAALTRQMSRRGRFAWACCSCCPTIGILWARQRAVARVEQLEMA